VAGGAQGNYPQYHGIFYGAVSNNADPLKKNRCTLRVPQLLGSAVTTWALPLTPMVDPPKVGTLVAVLFTGGDLDNPVYLVVNPAVPIEGNNANVQPVGTTAAAGTSHKVAAADHVHTLANALESTAGNIQPVAGAASAGTSAKAARADHAHVGLTPGAGSFEVSSGVTGGGDTAATIDLFSRVTAGQSEIDVTATNLNINSNTINYTGGTLNLGNGTNSNINLNPQMVPPSTWPLSSDPNTGSSWATGERGYINDLVTAVNGVINSLRAHGLMA
jgi:hypothetical protein